MLERHFTPIEIETFMDSNQSVQGDLPYMMPNGEFSEAFVFNSIRPYRNITPASVGHG